MDDCEKFLARQLPWIRAVLKSEYSPDIGPALAQPGSINSLNKASDEYEELLKQCPKHLREYREAELERARQIVLWRLPQKKQGRPASREVREVGQEAAELHTQGLSYGEIAQRLCEHRSEPDHKCGKRCADRMRQRAHPYLSAK